MHSCRRILLKELHSGQAILDEEPRMKSNETHEATQGEVRNTDLTICFGQIIQPLEITVELD